MKQTIKKLASLACVGALALGLAGCKGKKQYIVNRYDFETRVLGFKNLNPNAYRVWSPAKAENEKAMLKTYWVLVDEKDLRKIGLDSNNKIGYRGNN